MSGRGQEQVIEVTVKTIDGDSEIFKFNCDQLVKQAFQRVFARLNIKPAPGVIYHFAIAVGQILDENKTWKEQGITDGAALLFGTEEEVG